jgi:RNA polymerase sigma-70 factor (ECF subfamily)
MGRKEDELALLREPMLRYAWLSTGSMADAQDIVQSAYLKALQALQKGQHPGNPRAWLAAIVHNQILEFRRRGSAFRRKLLRFFDLRRDPEEPDPALADLKEAVGRLSDPYRPIVILKFVQGFTVEEIATILDMPAETVKVYAWRGVRQLRELLGEEIR